MKQMLAAEQINTLKKEHLSNTAKIVITSHKSPDGDAIGSSLALYHFFKNRGLDVQVIIPDAIPYFLQWMDGVEDILIYEDQPEECEQRLSNMTLFFALDYNSFSRIGKLGYKMNAFQNGTKVLIDHHQSPNIQVSYKHWNTEASSTCELVYDFIQQLNGLDYLNKSAAEALYTGIMTDTGSFRFPSTSAQTHLIIADLIKRGASAEKIHSNIFDQNTLNRLKLVGFVLNERMNYLPQFNAVLMHLTLEDLKQYNYQKGDTEGLVNYGLSIKGTKFVAIVIEHEDIIKISFRSKGNMPVNELSAKYFDGGGHKNAAGGRGEISVEKTLEKIQSKLPEYQDILV